MKGKLFCKHTTVFDLDSGLITCLRLIEEKLGIEFYVTSGVRCEKCNKEAGGTENSSHLPKWENWKGELKTNSIDIYVVNSVIRAKVIYMCKDMDITRIGVGSNFLHIDNNPYKVKPAMWGYS